MDRPTGSGTRADQRVVGGRYTLLAPLGSGGMGAVWRARDERLDREVAVKEIVFPPGLSDAERDVLRERTRREARAAAKLHHPSAVTVHDVIDHDGAPFLVMELVPARTLADVVRTDGPPSPQRAAQVGLAVLGALAAAHRQGIVHRDVKPGNVLISDGPGGALGRVVLSDFGIARTAGDPSITSSGLLLGSPSYIAPERASGVDAGPAADLWALGATLFTAVEGRPPYDAGEALATVMAVVHDERAPQVASGPLEPVINGLLEPDPARRLDADAAQRMLEPVAAQPAPAAPPPTAAMTDRADRTEVLPVGRVRDEQALDPYPAEPAAAVAAPPAQRPVRPAPRRRRGSVPLVLAALLLLATLAGVGLLLAGAAGDDGEQPTAAPTPTPTTATDAAETPTEPAAPTADAQEPTAEATTAGGPVPPPEGWQSDTAGPGWTVHVPGDWTRGSFNGAPEYRDPETGRTLRVETTGPGGGKDDAVQDRRDQAASFSQRYPSYREIAIEPIDYRGYEAADWEFTYAPGDSELHALSRVFVVDGRGYSLFFQTPAGDDWEQARGELEQISASFEPA
ncbi:MAG: serine/threonine-protein kinase [Actinomycetes bacterium]